MKEIKILMAFSLLFFTSCRSVKYVPVEVKPDSVIVERIDTLITPPDSAAIEALLECNEEGKVVLKALETLQTDNVRLALSLDSLGKLQASMNVKHDTITLPAKTIYKDRPIPVEVEKKVSLKEKMSDAIIPFFAGMIITLFLLYKKLRYGGKNINH